MSYADITPDTSLVASWANQLHRWPTITGELIDNALDANATRVILTLARDQISIEDNGVGRPDLGSISSTPAPAWAAMELASNRL